MKVFEPSTDGEPVSPRRMIPSRSRATWLEAVGTATSSSSSRGTESRRVPPSPPRGPPRLRRLYLPRQAFSPSSVARLSGSSIPSDRRRSKLHRSRLGPRKDRERREPREGED